LLLGSLNRWAEKQALGAKGVSMAISEMYDHHIVPCVPLIDIGYDLVVAHNNVLKRVQVKSTAVAPNKKTGSITFSTRRRKTCRKQREPDVTNDCYARKEIDAFIFVHTRLQLFFIIPGAMISGTRHKISFGPDSRWRDAWALLQK